MITVRVKQMGEKDFTELSVNDDIKDMEEFRNWLGDNYPREVKIPFEHCGIFINKLVVTQDYKLQDGDEVVLFPSIAGG